MSKLNQKKMGFQIIIMLVSRAISISRNFIRGLMTGLGREGDSIKNTDTINSVFWKIFCPQSGNFSSMISSVLSKYQNNPAMIRLLFNKLSLVIGFGFTSVYIILCFVINLWTRDMYSFIYSCGIAPIIYSMFVASFCGALLNVNGKFISAAGSVIFGNFSALCLLVIGRSIYLDVDFSIILTAIQYGMIGIMSIYSFVTNVGKIRFIIALMQIISFALKIFMYDNVFYLVQIMLSLFSFLQFEKIIDKIAIVIGLLSMLLGNVYGVWICLSSFVCLTINNMRYNAVKAFMLTLGVFSIFLHLNIQIDMKMIVYILLFFSQISYTVFQSISLFIQSVVFMHSSENNITEEMNKECYGVIKNICILFFIQSPRRVADVFVQILSKIIYPGFIMQVHVIHNAVCGTLQAISFPVKSMIQNVLSNKNNEDFANHAFKLLTIAHLFILASFLIFVDRSIVLSIVKIFTSNNTEVQSVLSLFPIVHCGIYFETISSLGQNILSVQNKMKNLARVSFATIFIQISFVTSAYILHKKLLPTFIASYLPVNYNIYGPKLLMFLTLVIYLFEFIAVFSQLIRLKSIKPSKSDIMFITISILTILQLFFFPIDGLIQYIITIPIYVGIVIRYILYVI